MIVTIERDGRTVTTEAQSGEKLIAVLQRAGVAVSAPCGGRCFCGKCTVQVFGETNDVCEAEKRFLTEEQIASGWRLACACEAMGDVRVLCPESRASVAVEGTMGRYELNPAACILRVTCEKPSLARQISDEERLLSALGGAAETVAAEALDELPEALRASDEVYAVVQNGVVRRLSAEKPRLYACAVDIGTTTMAAYLVDLENGAEVATASMLNPQRSLGGDVISRANHTMERPEGLMELAKLVRGGVNGLVREMCKKSGAAAEEICQIVLVGNTIMMHLLAGLCVRYIATLPFVPVYSATRSLPAARLDLVCGRAEALLGPCVAGYVGADTVAAALACDLDDPGETALLMDIGTNGEMVLRTKDGLWCCSAAAGPAFEGAHISCGSGAVEGAIDSVVIADGKAKITTIGGKPARSICGSGIVSAVAELLKEEIVDETGRMEEDFVLAEGVSLVQKDIREVQLAKAAIAAGVELLCEAAKIRVGDIRKVYLAGGFGSYIDKKAACEIGLIPMELLGRIESVGNAAGAGAKIMALDQGALTRAEALRKGMRYIELSASKDFQEKFADQMFFE